MLDFVPRERIPLSEALDHVFFRPIKKLYPDRYPPYTPSDIPLCIVPQIKEPESNKWIPDTKKDPEQDIYKPSTFELKSPPAETIVKEKPKEVYIPSEIRLKTPPDVTLIKEIPKEEPPIEIEEVLPIEPVSDNLVVDSLSEKQSNVIKPDVSLQQICKSDEKSLSFEVTIDTEDVVPVVEIASTNMEDDKKIIVEPEKITEVEAVICLKENSSGDPELVDGIQENQEDNSFSGSESDYTSESSYEIYESDDYSISESEMESVSESVPNTPQEEKTNPMVKSEPKDVVQVELGVAMVTDPVTNQGNNVTLMKQDSVRSNKNLVQDQSVEVDEVFEVPPESIDVVENQKGEAEVTDSKISQPLSRQSTSEVSDNIINLEPKALPKPESSSESGGIRERKVIQQASVDSARARRRQRRTRKSTKSDSSSTSSCCFLADTSLQPAPDIQTGNNNVNNLQNHTNQCAHSGTLLLESGPVLKPGPCRTTNDAGAIISDGDKTDKNQPSVLKTLDSNISSGTGQTQKQADGSCTESRRSRRRNPNRH